MNTHNVEPGIGPESVLAELHGCDVHPADAGAHYSLESYRNLVREFGEGALFKGAHPAHLTASLFVLSTDLTEVLLTHHKKAHMWLQFGGHLERTDTSLAEAARREGREESGLTTFATFISTPSDLDIHALGGGFGSVCREHWDIGFVALANRTCDVVVSAESNNVRWFPIHDLPETGNMRPRVEAALAHARKHVG